MNLKQLPLTNSDKTVLVDDEDYELLSKYAWKVKDKTKVKWYIWGWVGETSWRIHNFIMKPPRGLEVDHINGNTLDCQRSNLRVVDHSTNCRNRERQDTGVSFDKEANKWRARIGVDYKRIDLGRFETKEEALIVIQEARKQYFNA